MCCLLNFKVGRCNIQSAIIRAMDSMLDDIERYDSIPETSEAKIEMDDDVKSLLDAGFTSQKKVVEYFNWLEMEKNKVIDVSNLKDKLKKSFEYIEILSQARNTFGDDVLFVPFEKFIEIVSEYGAKCIGIPQYKDKLSQSKLSELIGLRKRGKDYLSYIKYEQQLIPVVNVRRDYKILGEEEYIEIMSRLKHFPFIKSKDGSFLTTIRFVDNSTMTLHNNTVQLGQRTDFFILSTETIFKKVGPIFCLYIGTGVLVFLRYQDLGGRRTFKRLSDFNRRLSLLGF